MPIYAYKCDACGHAKDVLQKISDDALSTCPACGKESFSKQVTAAGFQLKGSGWYVTDFRDGANKATGAPAPAVADGASAAAPASSGEASGPSTPSAAPAASAPASSSTTSTTSASSAVSTNTGSGT
jgi:putative FmdB family regulatory protein